MRRPLIVIASASLLLSGCSTFSFAPPPVNLHYKTTGTTAGCKPTVDTKREVTEDVAGALTLIDNYLEVYNCAMAAAADGRQVFEIPSFLALIGSTTAVALGAGKNVAIAGGTANSIFGAGNKYYAPQEQTTILSDGVSALSCIESEAVGISPTTLEAVSGEQENARVRGTGGTATVTVEEQYYRMVSSKLFDVGRATAQRLARRGSFDPAGVAAEIETQIKKINEAEEAKKKGSAPAVGVASLSANQSRALSDAQLVQLDLNVLEPKLAKCVTRAKG